MFAKQAIRLIPWLLVLILGLILFIQSPGFGPERIEGTMTINNSTVLEKVEALGKLELVKYSFQQITELKKDNLSYDFWVGRLNVPQTGAEIVLFTAGEAIGCIDLTKMRPEDLVEEGDTLWVTLPEPELCHFKVDLANTRIYALEVGYVEDERVFIDSAYRVAEQQIRDAALTSNIMEQTRENAKTMLGPFLEEVAGKTVLFREPLPVLESGPLQ